ncbi:MAG: hypothetical protein J6P74_07870 [Paludibacteraceae bacterium]|nr:hypothetical protein [Paludibacteraceae bacterium]
MLPHYPYTFLTRQNAGEVPALVYHFRSTKTKQWYIVRVEEYPNQFYGIKFYLKADSRSPRKYNRLTGLNEPRPVIYTCIAILMELAEQFPNASFGFIGANLIGESEWETKRFRVYRRILTTYFSEEHYFHYQIIEKSAYALVRKTVINNNPNIINEISAYFSDNYTNFD